MTAAWLKRIGGDEEQLGRAEAAVQSGQARAEFSLFETGFSFGDAISIPAKRGRSLMIGKWDGVVVSVVFVLLGIEAMTIIRLRRASKKERRLNER